MLNAQSNPVGEVDEARRKAPDDPVVRDVNPVVELNIESWFDTPVPVMGFVRRGWYVDAASEIFRYVDEADEVEI